MILNKENVLKTVQEKGPLLPNQVKKTLGGDSLIIGALLSELLDSKQIVVSRTKFGSSPAYYIPKQEKKLIRLTSYLSPTEKKSLHTLQTKKILIDTHQKPEMRLALRNLSDFAKPLVIQGKLYWKWHSLPDAEALKLAQKERTQPKKSKTKKTKSTQQKKRKKTKKRIKQKAILKKKRWF